MKLDKARELLKSQVAQTDLNKAAQAFYDMARMVKKCNHHIKQAERLIEKGKLGKASKAIDEAIDAYESVKENRSIVASLAKDGIHARKWEELCDKQDLAECLIYETVAYYEETIEPLE